MLIYTRLVNSCGFQMLPHLKNSTEKLNAHNLFGALQNFRNC